jgi:hypothetical protein
MPPFPGLAGSAVPQQALCSLAPGDSAYVFGVAPAGQGSSNAIDDTNVLGEEPVAILPAASASVAIIALPKGPPPMITVDIAFVDLVGGVQVPSAPGVFEIDVQEADVNCDADFITPTVTTTYFITAVIAATQRARADFSPIGGNFVRLLIKSLTNDVEVIAKITRKS